jgi:hypothetical protein
MRKFTDDEVKLMLDTLLFYAEPLTYFAIGFWPDRPCGEFMDDFSEARDQFGVERTKPGKRARELFDKLDLEIYYEDDDD